MKLSVSDMESKFQIRYVVNIKPLYNYMLFIHFTKNNCLHIIYIYIYTANRSMVEYSKEMVLRLVDAVVPSMSLIVK